MNPETDLAIDRLFAASPEKVWRCWTDADLLKQWWAPKPVVTKHVELDLAPGGVFHTVMQVPDHGDHPTHGCILQVVPARLLVWTDLMLGGFRPVQTPMFGFTARITFTPEGTGTRYRAVVMHQTADIARRHAQMGFDEGWGTCADQLGNLAGAI